MRGVLVTLIAAAGLLATPCPGLGETAGTGLSIRKAKVRFHRYRGMSRDRMRVRATFPLLQEGFDPWRDPIDFLVAGTEVLCEPGGFPPPEDPSEPPPSEPPPPPPPPPPPSYQPPVDGPDYGAPGGTAPAPRQWTLRERADGTLVFRTDGRRVDLDLVHGTIAISGRNLDLDALSEAGPAAADLAFVFGTEEFGAVIDFGGRGRTWSFTDR